MKKTLLGLLITLSGCAVSTPEYQPNWESLAKYEEAPEWFKDAKFGIYLHWGVYSVPEYMTEWYPRYVYFPWHEVAKFHEKTYGPVGEFDYHKLVPLFTGEDFNAKEWASLFKQAGARMAGLVAEHHDGFAMWDSECTPWNAADMGPHKDIVGELNREIKRQGMKFVTTFHHARNLQRYADPEKYRAEMARGLQGNDRRHLFYDSHFPYKEGTAPASNDSILQYLYGNMPAEKWYKEVWLGKLEEVIDKYDPDLIYFDSWLDLIPENYREQFCAYYFNKAVERNKEVVVVRKQEDLPLSVSVENIENARKADLHPITWETDETISYDSWSYTKDFKIKPAGHLVHELIDIVSKNGVFLLNISPRASGLIPDDQRQVLLEIGRWLNKYGEAIYGTRPWYTYGEGPTQQPEGNIKNRKLFDQLKYTDKDFRFTTKGDCVYILTLSEPTPGSTLTIRSFAQSAMPQNKPIKKVSMLGSTTPIEWTVNEEGLNLNVPEDTYHISTVYKVEF